MSEPSGLLRSTGFRVNSWKMKKRRAVRWFTEKTEEGGSICICMSFSEVTLFFPLNLFTAALFGVKRQFCSQTHFLLLQPSLTAILNSKGFRELSRLTGLRVRPLCLFLFINLDDGHFQTVTVLDCYTISETMLLIAHKSGKLKLARWNERRVYLKKMYHRS